MVTSSRRPSPGHQCTNAPLSLSSRASSLSSVHLHEPKPCDAGDEVVFPNEFEDEPQRPARVDVGHRTQRGSRLRRCEDALYGVVGSGIGDGVLLFWKRRNRQCDQSLSAALGIEQVARDRQCDQAVGEGVQLASGSGAVQLRQNRDGVGGDGFSWVAIVGCAAKPAATANSPMIGSFMTLSFSLLVPDRNRAPAPLPGCRLEHPELKCLACVGVRPVNGVVN